MNKIPLITKPEIKNLASGAILATTAESLREIDTLVQTEFDTLATYNAYPVTQLNPEFLLKKFREQKVKKTYLIIKK